MECINISCLKCPICLETVKNPYILPCPSKCMAWKECITKMFNVEPRHFQIEAEVQIVSKCLCNVENILIDKCVPAYGVDMIKKNLIQKCPKFHKGCSFFY